MSKARRLNALPTIANRCVFCCDHGLLHNIVSCRYAGAGLFDSVQTQLPAEVVADTSADKLVNDFVYQSHMLAIIAGICAQIEQIMGSPQDVEGVVDSTDSVHIVQTRPQV